MIRYFSLALNSLSKWETDWCFHPQSHTSCKSQNPASPRRNPAHCLVTLPTITETTKDFSQCLTSRVKMWISLIKSRSYHSTVATKCSIVLHPFHMHIPQCQSRRWTLPWQSACATHCHNEWELFRANNRRREANNALGTDTLLLLNLWRHQWDHISSCSNPALGIWANPWYHVCPSCL